MATPSSPPSAAGLLLALSIAIGAGVGIWLHQPSAGLLIGVVIGAAIIFVQWLLERRAR